MRVYYIKLLIYIFINFSVVFADSNLFINGNKYYTDRNYTDAINSYESALKTIKLNNTELAELLYKLSKSYTYIKNYDTAIKYLQLLVEKIPNDPRYIENGLYLLSNLYNLTGDRTKAAALKNYLTKKFPGSIYTQSKYWAAEQPIKSDADITESAQQTKLQTVTTETAAIPEPQSELIPVKTNIEYILIDFDKAALKSVIENFSAITKINYKVDFYNITDYLTAKSDNRISIKFLPVFLSKILEDYNYELKEFAGSYRVSKPVIFTESYSSLHKYYYVLPIDKSLLDKIELILNEINYSDIQYYLYRDFNYFIIQSDNFENIYKFLDALKITTANIGKYSTKNFIIRNSQSSAIASQLLSIMNTKTPLSEIFKDKKILNRKDLYVRNILTSQENAEIIKSIKNIKDNIEQNTITLTYPKENENKITEIINKLDVNIFQNESVFKTYNLKYSSAENTAKMLEELFKDEFVITTDNTTGATISEKLIKQISADRRTNTVIVNADADALSKIDEIILKTDIELSSSAIIPHKIKSYKLKNQKSSDLKKQFDMFLTAQSPIKIAASIADDRTNILIIIAAPSDFETIDMIVAELDKDIAVYKEKKTITAIFETKHRTPEHIINSLEKIIVDGIYKNTIDKIKIIPVDKQNIIVVISDNPSIISAISDWIIKLDTQTSNIVKTSSLREKEMSPFIYNCKNIPAEDLAGMLNNMLGMLKLINSNGANIPADKQPDDLIKYISTLSANMVITADKTSNTLLINATRNDYQNLLMALEEIDKIPDQIFIDVVIAEVALSDNSELGFEWSIGNSNKLSTNLNMGAYENLSNNFLQLTGLRYSVLDTKKFSAVMNWMQSNSQMKILSRPRITTAHNKKAVIKVGKEVPVTIVQQNTSDKNNLDDGKYYNYLNQYTEFKDVGITLTVTPTSIVNNMIGLNLHLIVSEIDASQQMTNIMNNPTINKREAETFGNVLSNNTIVIGGLIKQDESTSVIKVPVLSEIPLLGGLFKRNQTKKENTELLIFITPVLTHSAALYGANINTIQQ